MYLILNAKLWHDRDTNDVTTHVQWYALGFWFMDYGTS